jgi:50S ribosomal subunit-associated GTPase HflX
LALNKADLVKPGNIEAIVRQAHPQGGEAVVISAINPASLRGLLEKAGSILAKNLGSQASDNEAYESEFLSRIA